MEYENPKQGPTITTSFGDMYLSIRFQKPEDIFKWTNQELHDMMNYAYGDFLRKLRNFWGHEDWKASKNDRESNEQRPQGDERKVQG